MLDGAGARSTVFLSDGRRQIAIWAEDSFRWWQVYTSDYFPPTDPKHRAAVAIEAMTCGPDAYNTGRDLIVLEPGRRWSASWGAQLAFIA